MPPSLRPDGPQVDAGPVDAPQVNAPRGLGARILLITDPAYDAAHVDATIVAVATALAAVAHASGALAVQLRDKSATPSALRVRARALRALTASCGASLIVNGDPAIAAAVDADGVHVPGFARDVDAIPRVRAIVGPARSIHVPVHTLEEAKLARDAGVDALLVSPIFDSPGKGPARGPSALEEVRDLAHQPPLRATLRVLRIYALGGVDVSRVSECHQAGADGVAVIRALFDAPDPVATANYLILPWLTAS